MSTVDTADWTPESEPEWQTEGSAMLPKLPPISEADITAFHRQLASFPDGSGAKLPRWPFGVRCQGGCACHCNHTNCACQEGSLRDVLDRTHNDSRKDC